MICGALQTLNEDAFEDVAGSESQRQSPTNGITGELYFQHLTPIRESSEFGGSPPHKSTQYSDFFEHNFFNVNHQPSNEPIPTVIMMPQYASNVDDTKL
jgi:ankyrin repeat-rich membrane spanning protein